MLSGLSPLGERWQVHHDVLKDNGKKAVTIDIEGVILDLTSRKPALPPDDLAQIFSLIPRGENFCTLPDSMRSR